MTNQQSNVFAFKKRLDENFGVKLVPEKNVEYTLCAEDALIVVLEDETFDVMVNLFW